MAAFRAAMESGAGGIELDIHLSKDGAPVIFHDATLQRMTGVPAELSSLTLAELKKLRLLQPDGATSKERIPTLLEVLDWIDREKPDFAFVVNIELKDAKSVEAVAALVQAQLAKGWSAERLLISSFDLNNIRLVKALLPAVPVGALFECSAEDLPTRIREAGDLKVCTINVPFEALNEANAKLIESLRCVAVVWTPNEMNPYDLSQTNREQLLRKLREQEFVVITDYPKELLQLLKPSKTRATVTGVLAACLSYGQQDMLFRPSESGLEKLRAPSEYPQLSRFGFAELELRAEDGVPCIVWERKGSLDRPHFLLFHGNRAHWGDTGAGDRKKDRQARLKFIEALASGGAGVTAVTLRGFGRSSAIPSELGFRMDLRAVTEHLARTGFNHRKLVVAGESLGTWAATQTAVYLTQQGAAPALVSLQNPFTCMADVGEQVVSHFPFVRSFGIGISASALDRHVLKSHFYTAKLLGELSPSTRLHIGTSGKDDLVSPAHSDKLAAIARNAGLQVVQDVFPDALHHTIPPVDYARRLICLGVEACSGTSDSRELWSELVGATRSIDRIPYL
jgi:glycerophosphoryl diester phosphodiesterase